MCQRLECYREIHNPVGISDTWAAGLGCLSLVSGSLIRIPFYVDRGAVRQLKVSLVVPTDRFMVWMHCASTKHHRLQRGPEIVLNS